MHMLRNEENSEYRNLIVKTLELDPRILGRYVNFMNNPDEETAFAQFGSEEKYFGICILMATLPGLPMFGHGQIEGYTEKYGMEYQRAYYDEKPDQDLINRHVLEIFPLLKKRSLFAEVDHFYLFDVDTTSGKIIEDIIAFSNCNGQENVLVVYNNSWAQFDGSIRNSTPINGFSISLLNALNITDPETDFIFYREHITGLEFVRSIKDFLKNGFEISLAGYQAQVFLDFKLIKPSEEPNLRVSH
jgi:hypothetical protein